MKIIYELKLVKDTINKVRSMNKDAREVIAEGGYSKGWDNALDEVEKELLLK
jgi:hypothetical protein